MAVSLTDLDRWTYENKSIDGVVHSVRRLEDRTAFGTTSCFLTFTVERKDYQKRAQNAMDAPDEPLTCIKCLALLGYLGSATYR